jgi:hypothetical protein
VPGYLLRCGARRRLGAQVIWAPSQSRATMPSLRDSGHLTAVLRCGGNPAVSQGTKFETYPGRAANKISSLYVDRWMRLIVQAPWKQRSAFLTAPRYFCKLYRLRLAAAQFARNFSSQTFCTCTLAAGDRLYAADLPMDLATAHMKHAVQQHRHQ